MGCQHGSRPWCWGSMGYVPAEGCSINHCKTFSLFTQISVSLSHIWQESWSVAVLHEIFLFRSKCHVPFMLIFRINFCLGRFSFLFYLRFLYITSKNAMHLHWFLKSDICSRASFKKHNETLLLFFHSSNYL